LRTYDIWICAVRESLCEAIFVAINMLRTFFRVKLSEHGKDLIGLGRWRSREKNELKWITGGKMLLLVFQMGKKVGSHVPPASLFLFSHIPQKLARGRLEGVGRRGSGQMSWTEKLPDKKVLIDCCVTLLFPRLRLPLSRRGSLTKYLSPIGSFREKAVRSRLAPGLPDGLFSNQKFQFG
jgi:hypothetical protein